MPQQWFMLSLDDGGLVPSKPPLGGATHHWREAQLEHTLFLNPELLGVADHLPICVGGTTQTLSDQAYIDDLGRIVVIEIKNERAGIPALAQLIAYADHWRLPPASVVNQMLRSRTGSDGDAALLGRFLVELRA